MLYGGFVLDLAKKIERQLEEIQVEYNFEYGAEYEIALCVILQRFLPDRFRVCRGYVVEQSGKCAGDDIIIIIYDAARFPTLRLLGDNLALKERVPAEAVVAYIEAKHTLYIDKDDCKRHKGQSLDKALKQVAAVKALKRDDVPLSNVAPYFNFPGIISNPPGNPPTKNPWFAMIVAPLLKTAESKPCHALRNVLLESTHRPLPDVIAAGNIIVEPALIDRTIKHVNICSFLCTTTELVVKEIDHPAAVVAILHMMMALEWIILSDLPWPTMLKEVLATNEDEKLKFIYGNSPIR
ncbi:MAG: DUF6602 domain-containing protein [Armatimonadota bacterium]